MSEKNEVKHEGRHETDSSQLVEEGATMGLAHPDSLERRDFLAAGGTALLGAAVFSFSDKTLATEAIYTSEVPSNVPPEYTAPSDTLKPGPHDSDYYVESTGASEENANVNWWLGRNVGGVTIGLIQLRAHLPMAPGNMGNATTFDFPLLYREMLPENPYDIMALKPEKPFVDEIVKAARWLELQGVRAIMGNCGFFGTYQIAVAERIDTPFFSSSLIQLPTILQSLPRSKKVGVITANGEVLAAGPAIENCGVSPEDKKNRIVIEGCENGSEFKKVLGLEGNYNMLKLEREIVEAAERIVKRDKDVRAILLECTELPPAAYAVQNAVRLPVWDYTTLTKWIHLGCLRRPFTGII
jgi:Asp/Glu/hydantoin racemase